VRDLLFALGYTLTGVGLYCYLVRAVLEIWVLHEYLAEGENLEAWQRLRAILGWRFTAGVLVMHCLLWPWGMVDQLVRGELARGHLDS
jgi:hypothetical protein